MKLITYTGLQNSGTNERSQALDDLDTRYIGHRLPDVPPVLGAKYLPYTKYFAIRGWDDD